VVLRRGLDCLLLFHRVMQLKILVTKLKYLSFTKAERKSDLDSLTF